MSNRHEEEEELLAWFYGDYFPLTPEYQVLKRAGRDINGGYAGVGTGDSGTVPTADQGLHEYRVGVADIAGLIELQVNYDVELLKSPTGFIEPPEDRQKRWGPILDATPPELKGQVEWIRTALDTGYEFAMTTPTWPPLVLDCGVFTPSTVQNEEAAYLLTCMTTERAIDPDRFYGSDGPQFSAGLELVRDLKIGNSLQDPALRSISAMDVITAALQFRPTTPAPQP